MGVCSPGGAAARGNSLSVHPMSSRAGGPPKPSVQTRSNFCPRGVVCLICGAHECTVGADASSSPSEGRQRTPSSLVNECRKPPRSDHRNVNDLVPGEPTAEPPRRRNDRGLPAGVVDRLVPVVLPIELNEQPQRRPGEVDSGDELST